MIESTSMASLLTERCYRSTPRGALTAHAWGLCQCETGACQYHWCSIYRGLERVGSWVPGGSVGRDQLAMAAKVRRHWFNPCRLGSRGHLGANFSLLLYTDLIKKRKPSRAAKKPNLNFPPYLHRASYAPVWKAIHSNSPRVIGNIVFSKNKNAVAMADSNLKNIQEVEPKTCITHWRLNSSRYKFPVYTCIG